MAGSYHSRRRPPRPGHTPPLVWMNVCIEPRHRDRLHELSARLGCPVSAVLGAVLNRWLEAEELTLEEELYPE
jgi:hypothetical protein